MTTDTTTDTAGDSPDAGAGSFVLAHVEQLLDNPADARAGQRSEEALVELAASIRSVGLLQALTVVPDPGREVPDRFVIYTGHRRRDAARLAGHQLIAAALGHDIAADPTLGGLDVDPGSDQARAEAGPDACAAADRLAWVPCLIRPDLAANVGMDIAAALIENGVRDDLTTGQRARGAEQLSLADGWTVTRIVAATGLSRRQARAAAALPRLGDTARQAAYRGELSLEHAAVLDDLAADGATDDELARLARSGTMFDHHVAELGKTLRRRTAAAALGDEADTRGWTVYDEPDGYPLDSTLAPLWSLSRAEDPDTALLARGGEDADPTADRGAAAWALLPGHGVLLHNDPWEDPHLEVVCADPEGHGHRRDPRSLLYTAPEPEVEHEPDIEPEPVGDDSSPPTHPGADSRGASPHGAPGADQTPEPGPDGDSDGRDGDGGEDLPATASVDGGPTDEAAGPAAAARAEQRRIDAEQQAAEQAARNARAVAERAEQRRVEAEQQAAENARLEAERAAARARSDALATAADTRWQHTAGLLRTQKAAAAHGELPAVVLARFPWLLAEVDDVAGRGEITALCADPDRDPRTGAGRWSPGRITHRAVVITAWLLHQHLTAVSLMGPALLEPVEAEPAIWWSDYLTARGYQPAAVETEARAELDRIVTETRGDADGSGGEDSAEEHGPGPDRH